MYYTDQDIQLDQAIIAAAVRLRGRPRGLTNPARFPLRRRARPRLNRIVRLTFRSYIVAAVAHRVGQVAAVSMNAICVWNNELRII